MREHPSPGSLRSPASPQGGEAATSTPNPPDTSGLGSLPPLLRDRGRGLSDLTTKCIRCGFCLESCPTFTETGLETASPRGRIYLIRSADEGHLAWDQEHVGQYLDACLGCRACEPACPSGVQYGAILELARERLEQERPKRGVARVLAIATSPQALRLQLFLGRFLPGKRVPAFVSRLLTHERPEADRPWAQKAGSWRPLTRFTTFTDLSPRGRGGEPFSSGRGGEPEAELPPVRGKVYLLEGCAMRVLYPRVHEATRRLLRRVGYQVAESNAGCCGALHAHQGLRSEAELKVRDLEAAMPGDLPIIVDSAGCGSHLKERLGDRVFDVSEFLYENGLIDVLKDLSTAGLHTNSEGMEAGAVSKVAYHDACHLVHGQKVYDQPRALLEAIPWVRLVPLKESDTCCGSAGIYNLTQPKMARALLERKWAHIEASGAETVALGNPGCHAWITQAAREKNSPIQVLHTVEILEAALSGCWGGPVNAEADR